MIDEPDEVKLSRYRTSDPRVQDRLEGEARDEFSGIGWQHTARVVFNPQARPPEARRQEEHYFFRALDRPSVLPEIGGLQNDRRTIRVDHQHRLMLVTVKGILVDQDRDFMTDLNELLRANGVIFPGPESLSESP